MKKYLHTLTLFGLIILIISSCNTSSNLTDSAIIKKRRYTKGYQVSIKGFQKGVKASDETALRAEKVEATEVGEKQYADLAEASITPDESTSNSLKSDLELASNAIANQGESKSGDKYNHKLSEQKYATEKSWTKKEIRKNLKKQRTSSGSPAAAGGESLVLYVILAIILPPLAVGLLYGIGTEFLISLVLTLIFWLPGAIYALIKVFQQG